MKVVMEWLKSEFILSIVITVITSILFNAIFKDWRLGVIAGLVLGLYSFMLSLYNNLEKKIHTSSDKLLNNQRETIDLLEINDLHSNAWLKQVLKRVASIESYTRSKNHDVLGKFIKQELAKNLKDLESTFYTGQKLYYNGWDSETERQIWLKDIIQGSNCYVKAVTSYDPIYWQNFWGRTNFSKEYFHANISAAERGVNVERIFILSDDILNGHDTTLCSLVKSFVVPMLNKSTNLKTLFVSTSQIPQFHNNYKTSNFLLSDDIFVGFSENFSEGDQSSGFISILDTKELQKCFTIYRTLIRYAENAYSFPFIKEGL
jgi:hypothetical protein